MPDDANAAAYEIWRRVQDHRDAERLGEISEADRLLAPLVLSLARLAAQREARRSPPCVPLQQRISDVERR
jgi:hypothetical protein